MTRINCVPPSELSDRHLLAEYRELPRVFNLARKANLSKIEIPESYRMGTGHVLFFYDKLRYLQLRWLDLINELVCRKFNLDDQLINSVIRSWNTLPQPMCNNWHPDATALSINRERIKERTKQSNIQSQKTH